MTHSHVLKTLGFGDQTRDAGQACLTLPRDRVYRLWASLESGETFYCGEFNTDSQGSVFVHLDPPGQFPGGPATNVFVTIDQASATPEANQDRVLMGRIN